MLDTIRKRKGNFIVTFIILIIVGVMAVYGIGEFARDRSTGEVAWVNGEPISVRDYQQQLSLIIDRYRAMFGDQMDERLTQNALIRQQALEGLIDSRLLSQNAKDLGFSVSDKELADYIQRLPYFQKNGKFDYESYQKIQNRGIQERRMREELRVERFVDYLRNRVQVTPAELVRSFVLQESKVDLEYAKIDLGNLSGKMEPSESEVKAFLSDSQAEKQIQAYYDSRTSEFSQPAQVELRQIRAAIPFQAGAEVKKKAKEKIEAIAKEATAQNFAAVAKAKSDDEYAAKGGLRGWVSRGSLEKSLESALDKLKPGQVSAPVETTFGYYVLLVENTKPPAKLALDGVKHQIARTLVLTKKRKAFEDSKKSEWEKKLQAGTSIEPDLKALKIDVKKTGPFSLAQGYIPQIGEVPSIIDAVASLNMKDRVAKKLFYHQEHLYFIRLANVETPKESDFAKHRESVARTLDSQFQNLVLGDWVQKLKKEGSIQKSKRLVGSSEG